MLNQDTMSEVKYTENSSLDPKLIKVGPLNDLQSLLKDCKLASNLIIWNLFNKKSNNLNSY